MSYYCFDPERPFFPDGSLGGPPLDREYPVEVAAVFGVGDSLIGKPKQGGEYERGPQRKAIFENPNVQTIAVTA
jgi:hypothetical protein